MATHLVSPVTAASKTIAEQLDAVLKQAPANMVQRHGESFDPLTFVQTACEEDKFVAGMLSNLDWAVSNRVIRVATGLAYDVIRENPGTANDIGALIDAFHGTLSHEGYWGEGSAYELVKLCRYLPDVQDAAYKAAARTGYLNYTSKSIDDLILKQKPMPMSVDEARMIEIEAEFISKRVKGKLSSIAIRDELLAKRAEDAKNYIKRQIELLPAINVIVTEAESYLKIHDEINAGFPNLDLTSRMYLANAQYGAIDRTRDQMRKRRDTTNTEYMMALVDSVTAEETLKLVIQRLADEFDRTRGDTSEHDSNVDEQKRINDARAEKLAAQLSE